MGRAVDVAVDVDGDLLIRPPLIKTLTRPQKGPKGA